MPPSIHGRVSGGSVSGTVKDATDAVVSNATVTATNIDTGVHSQVTTNDRGYYSFPVLAVGRYNIAIAKAGFTPYQRTGVTIDTNSNLTVNAVLQIGGQAEAVTVVDTAVHVETSDTQMGEVISANKMTAVPLNGRSYTDLLAPARRCSHVIAYVEYAAGCGRERAFALRQPESRNDFDQRYELSRYLPML